MGNFIKVYKLNPEFAMLRKMIEAEDETMTLEEVVHDKYVRDMCLKNAGLDPAKVSLKDSYELWLDLDKILGIGIIEQIPGLENLEGFAIWFNNNAKDCWYLDKCCYDEVMHAINKNQEL